MKTSTLEEFSDDFIEIYARANNRWGEVENKKGILKNHLLPFFGEMSLDSIGEREIDEFKALKADEGISSKTINNYLTCLRKMLVVARDWKLIEVVPVFRWLKVSKQRFDFLQFKEAEKLLSSAEPEWKPMMITALKAGLRHGELMELHWDRDIDFENRIVNVNNAMYMGKPTMGTKTGLIRSVPMCDILYQTLLDHHKHRRSELVFTNPDGGQLTAAQCRSPLDRACKKAGLRHISWHVFRHTFASHLAMKGVSLKHIQELLGHTSINTTMRYAHLCKGALSKSVKVLD